MEPMKPMQPMQPMAPMERWWPEALGEPATSGGQNEMRYAFFPAKRRLLIESGGKLTTYDTGEHQISGVAQQHSGTGRVSFTSQSGLIKLDDLEQVQA